MEYINPYTSQKMSQWEGDPPEELYKNAVTNSMDVTIVNKLIAYLQFQLSTNLPKEGFSLVSIVPSLSYAHLLKITIKHNESNRTKAMVLTTWPVLNSTSENPNPNAEIGNSVIARALSFMTMILRNPTLAARVNDWRIRQNGAWMIFDRIRIDINRAVFWEDKQFKADRLVLELYLRTSRQKHTHYFGFLSRTNNWLKRNARN